MENRGEVRQATWKRGEETGKVEKRGRWGGRGKYEMMQKEEMREGGNTVKGGNGIMIIFQIDMSHQGQSFTQLPLGNTSS